MQPDHGSALLEFVRTRLVREAGAAVEPDSALFEEGWINSINILDLIGFVERRLGRRLADDEIVMAHFRSVQAIAGAFFND